MAVTVDPLFWQVARWLLFGIFAVALWHKLGARDAFVAIVDDYRLLPRKAVRAAAATVMALEALVLAGLASSPAARPAAGLAMILLVVYALAIAVNLARGRRDIDCGCTGPATAATAGHRLSAWLLVRNGALAVLGAVVTLPTTERALIWVDAASIVAGAAAALLVYVTMDQLIANRPLLNRMLQ